MDPKLGVALTKCFFCGKDDRIVLNSLLTRHMAEKVEKMHHKVIDMEPCRECKDYMKQGIILLTIDPMKSEDGWEKSSMPNPYRTGGFFVLKDEACKRFMQPSTFEWVKKHRFMFIEHEAAKALGLFTAEVADG